MRHNVLRDWSCRCDAAVSYITLIELLLVTRSLALFLGSQTLVEESVSCVELPQGMDRDDR